MKWSDAMPLKNKTNQNTKCENSCKTEPTKQTTKMAHFSWVIRCSTSAKTHSVTFQSAAHASLLTDDACKWHKRKREKHKKALTAFSCLISLHVLSFFLLVAFFFSLPHFSSVWVVFRVVKRWRYVAEAHELWPKSSYSFQSLRSSCAHFVGCFPIRRHSIQALSVGRQEQFVCVAFVANKVSRISLINSKFHFTSSKSRVIYAPRRQRWKRWKVLVHMTFAILKCHRR